MYNRKFYKITENEFVNVDLILSIKMNADSITLFFANGDKKSYKLNDLAIHFQNFLDATFL